MGSILNLIDEAVVAYHGETQWDQGLQGADSSWTCASVGDDGDDRCMSSRISSGVR